MASARAQKSTRKVTQKQKPAYGAHQYFMNKTRKDRLAEFGIKADPHTLDVTQFLPPSKPVIFEKDGTSHALVPFPDHEEMEIVVTEEEIKI